MKTIILTPDQLIAQNDYPLYSTDVLRRYVEQCKANHVLALVPVISVEIVRQHFDADLVCVLDAFIAEHPTTRHFTLDGNHRTTAKTLTGRDIHAIIYETDADILEARTLVVTGQVLQNGTLDMSLVENCVLLGEYFSKKPFFETVRQKTARLIEDGHIQPIN